tara:strand:+ start:965 stop:1180 length:216 start_codon:yes stop_codon:yes gene_type:complete
MFTNPMKMALKGVPKLEEPNSKKKSKSKAGLLSRSMDTVKKPNSTPEQEIKMRVARYVQDIRNKRNDLKNA